MLVDPLGSLVFLRPGHLLLNLCDLFKLRRALRAHQVALRTVSDCYEDIASEETHHTHLGGLCGQLKNEG